MKISWKFLKILRNLITFCFPGFQLQLGPYLGVLPRFAWSKKLKIIRFLLLRVGEEVFGNCEAISILKFDITTTFGIFSSLLGFSNSSSSVAISN